MPSAETWTAIGAIAGVVVAAFAIWSHVRRRLPWRKTRVFLSMQMTGLNGTEYEDVRRNVMGLVYELRKKHKVYFYNEFLQRVEDFDESAFDAPMYLKKINKCDIFVAVVTKKVLSSIYFEAGVALSEGRRCVFFVPDDNVLPFVMRLVALDNEKVQIFHTSDLSDVQRILTNILERNAA